MPISHIRAFDRTFSTDGRSDIADALAAPWSPDPDSLRYFRTSANSVLTLTRNGERSFLRASLASERERRIIGDELAMLDTLSARGIPVVQPLLSDSGLLIETIATPMGDWHVVLFAALPGTIREADDLSVEDYARWGAAVGRIHAGLSTYPSTITRAPSWVTALDAIDASGKVPADARIGIARLRDQLEQLPTTPDWFGLLHGDLELDNLTWDDGTIHTLDFDAASQGWYLLDLAKTLSDPLNNGLTTESPEIGAFLAGYRQHRPLSDEALAFLPLFLALRDAVDYASLLHAIDIIVDEADADWMRGLTARLSAWMHEAEITFASIA